MTTPVRRQVPAAPGALHRRLSAEAPPGVPLGPPPRLPRRARTEPIPDPAIDFVDGAGQAPATNPVALAEVLRAVQDDIVDNATFLSDKDLHVAVRNMGMEKPVRLYSGPLPEGYRRRESSDRGNNCGIDSLMRVAQHRLGVEMTGATDYEIRSLRELIAKTTTLEDAQEMFVEAASKQLDRDTASLGRIEGEDPAARRRRAREVALQRLSRSLDDPAGAPAGRPVPGHRQSFWTMVDLALAAPTPFTPSRGQSGGVRGELPLPHHSGRYQILGGSGTEGEDAPDDVALYFDSEKNHFDVLVREPGRGGT